MKHILFCIASLILVISCAPTRPQLDIPENPPTARTIPHHLDVAIALGAGGAKGYAHIGALEVLSQAGVPIDLIAGSSVGSLIGTLYADKGSINQVIEAMMPAKLWTFADIDLAKPMGFVSGYQLEHFVVNHVHAATFKELKIPLLIVSTDLDTGAAYTIASGPLAPAIDASSSVPGLVVPTRLYGKTLVDGGVAIPVPVELLTPYKPKVTIAIDICSKLPTELPRSARGVYQRAYDIMWIELCNSSREQADIIIHPEIPASMGMFAIKQKCVLYQAGKEAAQSALPDILKLLQQNRIALQLPSQADIPSNQFCQTE